eukprot:tig00001094_g6973.t1
MARDFASPGAEHLLLRLPKGLQGVLNWFGLSIFLSRNAREPECGAAGQQRLRSGAAQLLKTQREAK